MKVLSLFDGISCGMVALERADIPVERYVAYEIDENAIKVSRSNYPHIEQCGDVFTGDFTQYSDFDLLIGGSPCTYWSVAKVGGGEKSGTKRETTSSGFGWELFSQYVRALKESKCRYFLYENNASMSKEIKQEITKALHVEPVLIDSAEFSAQERKRLYWTNINFSKEFPHCEKVIKDILYDINDELHKYRDFSKYVDTIRWNSEHTHMAYDTSGKGYYSQANRCRTIDSKSGTVPASKDDKNNIYWGGTTMKLIHPVEAERLQTLPDNYTKVLNTNSKRVSIVGNGWTVDVIAHILKGLKDKM